MRRTRAVISLMKIHQKGGQIVNFTDCKFFSEISFLNKIQTIFKSIFDVLQITRFIFVKLKSQLAKKSGFRMEKFISKVYVLNLC